MPLLDVQEVADFLKLSERTVRRKMARGAIPYVKIGRVVRFRREQLDEWLTAGCPTREKAPDLFSWAADRQGAAR